MTINQNNHHHINHYHIDHHPIIDHQGKGGSLILTLIGEADFRTLIGEIGFLILFLFCGSLDDESTLLWIDKINELFDMEYILIEDQIKFVTYKLKGRATI